MWDRLISLHRPVGTSQEENCRDVLDLSSPTTKVYRLYTYKSTIKIKTGQSGAFFLTKPHIACTMALSPAGKYTHTTPLRLCVGGFFWGIPLYSRGVSPKELFFSHTDNSTKIKSMAVLLALVRGAGWPLRGGAQG